MDVNNKLYTLIMQSSSLFVLPREVLGIIGQYLDRQGFSSLVKSCRLGNEAKPALCSQSSLLLNGVLATYIKRNDKPKLGTFLELCSGKNTPVHLKNVLLLPTVQSIFKKFNQISIQESVNPLYNTKNFWATIVFSSESQTVDLASASIDTIGLERLFTQCLKLKNVNLNECRLIDGKILATTAFPESLEELDVAESDVTGATLFNIIKRCPHLKRLNLRGCQQIDTKDFTDANFGAELEEIDLTDTAINKDGLINLFSKSQKLKKVILRECELLRERDFRELSFPPGVRELDLKKTAIGTRGLTKIFQDCPLLVELNLERCVRLSNRRFQRLTLPKELKNVCLKKTNIKLESMEALRKQFSGVSLSR